MKNCQRQKTSEITNRENNSTEENDVPYFGPLFSETFFRFGNLFFVRNSLKFFVSKTNGRIFCNILQNDGINTRKCNRRSWVKLHNNRENACGEFRKNTKTAQNFTR